MICDKCEYSNKRKTGVPSCMLPHCVASIDSIARRYAQLYGRRRTQEEQTEFDMLADEIRRNGIWKSQDK
jgi:hypothetical protein